MRFRLTPKVSTSGGNLMTGADKSGTYFFSRMIAKTSPTATWNMPGGYRTTCARLKKQSLDTRRRRAWIVGPPGEPPPPRPSLRLDVLVDVEEVGGVVLALDLQQALVVAAI